MRLLLAIAGMWLGAMLDNVTGAVFGLFIGMLAGILIHSRSRISALEQQVYQIRTMLDGSNVTNVTTDQETSGSVPDITEHAEPTAGTGGTDLTGDLQVNMAAEQTADEQAILAGPTVDTTNAWTAADPFAGTGPDFDPLAPFRNKIREFFTSGNVVAKVGVIILFFGIAFLLKYAVDRNVIAIEIRLAGVAAFGVILLIAGWRMRSKNIKYALVLQGAAVGILYLTVFSSARLYSVLPLGLTFIIMVALVVFSCMLAVIQDSRSLAVFAAAGGFLAPVLTSTGHGSHVALFTYYALLNAGIVGIAWHRAWRILNWQGFVFTFVIASLWGYNSYRPEHFSTTEPFLILFFLFYIAIQILFAYRQPPRLKGLVDGTLVFGTPLVGFSLQSLLVRNFEFGLALSALAVGILYISLAKILWKKQVDGMRLLTETYLVLGVIFLSLAVPFALDGRWTAAAWALEGAGMTWIGIRQRRLLPRCFGLLLHVGGAMAFLAASGNTRMDMAVFNSAFIGCLMISLGGLFSGYQSWRYSERLLQGEKKLHAVLLVWGLCWWFGNGLSEINSVFSHAYVINMSLLFCAGSMLLLTWSGRRLQWPAAELATVMLLPVMVSIALYGFAFTSRHLLADYGYLSWGAAFTIQYVLLYRSAGVWPEKLIQAWHSCSLWLLIFILARIMYQSIRYAMPDLTTWADISWGLIPSIFIFLLLYMRDHPVWPVMQYRNSYLGNGLFPVIAFTCMWVTAVCANVANPAPLPYVPVLNPQDLVQVFAMLVSGEWILRLRRQEIEVSEALQPSMLAWALSCVVFIWLNAVVAHAVHFYGGVVYRFRFIMESPLFQTSISILWTLTAFSIMALATRTGHRKIWFAGAVLLAAVVVKLIVIDLANSGTVTRIISFITVGVLMLIIGYLSPLPARQENRT
jgi:uncharacterized membrane protein